MVQREFWSGRRVLVTGHTGFKGSWLLLLLERLGAEVSGYALEPLPDAVLHRATRPTRETLADVRDATVLQHAFDEARPEIVLHLAAQPLVRASYREPVDTVTTNALGTVNVLEAVRRTSSVRAVVVVTTDKVYRNREWPWGYREHEPLGGHDPYSASKACTEILTAAWRDSFLASGAEDERDVRVATARAGNVIGGGDVSPDRLVPDALREIAAGRSVRLRNPGATRPWQHVLEPLGGYLLLAERLLDDDGARHARAWNFGPATDDARTVAEIVERLAACWSPDKREGMAWCQEGAPQPHEAGLLELDSALARTWLGWRPHWRLDAALADIVAWECDRLDGVPIREACLSTLERHAAGAATREATRSIEENER